VKKIISIIIFMIFVAGCGGSSNNRGAVAVVPPVENPPNVPDVPAETPPPNNPVEVITMVLNEPYQVDRNDELNKTSDEASVEVIHFEDGGTAVVLREGSATLTKY